MTPPTSPDALRRFLARLHRPVGGACTFLPTRGPPAAPWRPPRSGGDDARPGGGPPPPGRVPFVCRPCPMRRSAALAAPVVSSVTPVQGPASGGTTVTLTRDRPDRSPSASPLPPARATPSPTPGSRPRSSDRRRPHRPGPDACGPGRFWRPSPPPAEGRPTARHCTPRARQPAPPPRSSVPSRVPPALRRRTPDHDPHSPRTPVAEALAVPSRRIVPTSVIKSLRRVNARSRVCHLCPF